MELRAIADNFGLLDELNTLALPSRSPSFGLSDSDASASVQPPSPALSATVPSPPRRPHSSVFEDAAKELIKRIVEDPASALKLTSLGIPVKLIKKGQEGQGHERLQKLISNM